MVGAIARLESWLEVPKLVCNLHLPSKALMMWRRRPLAVSCIRLQGRLSTALGRLLRVNFSGPAESPTISPSMPFAPSFVFGSLQLPRFLSSTNTVLSTLPGNLTRSLFACRSSYDDVAACSGMTDSTPTRALRANKRKCAFCARAFSKTEHLERHIRSHTKEKPFECHHCGRKYGRK
jgi:hypothetical protein